MKALSIKQPWAWAIIHAGKDVENRTWHTNIRGRILIHASKKFDKKGWRWICRNMGRLGLADLPHSDEFKLISGGIVGSVNLVDCVTEYNSPWLVGSYGFLLANPKPMEFRPCKGRLGFFNIELDQREKA